MATPPDKMPPHSSQKKTTTRTRGENGRFESSVDPNTRTCGSCGRTDTTQWRTGPDGATLCNPCGIRLNRKASSGSRSPGESSNAAKKRVEIQRAAAAAAVAAAKRKKKNGSPPRKSSPGRLESGDFSRPGGSASHAAAIATASAHSPPRSSSDRSKKKRRDAYSIDSLLNPQ